MAFAYSPDELDREIARRQGVSSSETVLAPQEGAMSEFKKGVESTLKGAASGIIDLLGGWGNVYDKLKQETGSEPSMLSSQGLKEALNKLTGVNLQKIEGYKGLYTASQAAAPQVGLTALGLPGLFPKTVLGVPGLGIASEAAVAGGTALGAQTITPDSPIAQFLLQSTPYAIKGGINMARDKLTTPVGTLRPEAGGLLDVGPLTPGEATGSRVQLAKEVRTEGTPAIEGKGEQFRLQQSQGVENFLTKLFDRAANSTDVNPSELTAKVSTSLDNYGRGLSSKLRRDAATDFNAAKRAGGLVDTQPIIEATQRKINEIAPEVAGLQGLRSQLGRILDEFYIEGKPATETPSTILNASGQPAAVTTTAAVPAGAKKIDIGRLQQNLSAWGEAAYTGKFDIGGANVLEGVAPGQAKGIARAVLGGFKTALDEAIDNGVAGADKLVQARDRFAANLRQIDEFANKPFVKTFGKPVNELVPEQVAAKLTVLPESQRAVMVQLLGQDAPEVLSSIRRMQFDRVLGKAEVTNAAAESPTFAIDKALSEMAKKKGEFNFLFENPADRADALKAMQYMRTVLKSASGDTGALKGSDLYSGARAVGAQSGTANLIKELGLVITDIVASPNQMADVIFNKDTVKAMIAAQNRSTPQKIADVMTAIGKSTGNVALRAGPRMGDTNVQMPAAQGQVQEGPTAAEIDAEIQRRLREQQQ